MNESDIMLNFENHVISLAAGSFAAMTISEAKAASIAVILRPMRSPHEGGSQNAQNPTKLRKTSGDRNRDRNVNRVGLFLFEI